MLEFHFEKKPLHTVLPSNGSAGDLQTIDYSYHIRGGLRGINLDASGNLTNKMFSMKLGYEDVNFFDGNIGKQEWKTSLDNVTRSYTYGYDGASRITGGSYVGRGSENYSLNSVSYDLNGNIKTLSRNGLKSNNSFGLIDNLAYTYNSNSNKIQAVTDNSNESASFTDATGATDYVYSLDGSLTSDANKGITSIEYNYLKRPKKYTFSNGSTLENQYDAMGKKLKSISSDGTVYDFVGNLIYKNNVLYQISHDEGRIINGEYEYEIKDHLGNLRVSFRDSLGITKITQKQDYDVYGSELQGLSYTKPLWNQDNFKYLGRESISQTGYIDLLNRQYDRILGRFTSPDPVTDGQEDQSLYQYGWNNPVLRSDPNGLIPQDDNPMIKAAQRTQAQANRANSSFQQTKQSASEIVTVTGGGQVAGIGGGVKVGSARVQADVKFVYAEGSLNAGEQKAEVGLAKLEVSAQATKNKSLGGSVSFASGTASSKDGYSENGGFKAGSASATKNGKTLSSDATIGANGKIGTLDVGINIDLSKVIDTSVGIINTVSDTGKAIIGFIGNYISEGFNSRTNNTFSGSKDQSQTRKK